MAHAEPEIKLVRTEGGQGGRRGHSNMEHWDHTEEIKSVSRKVRRKLDRTLERRASFNTNLDDAP